jgi:hypothetical protein
MSWRRQGSLSVGEGRDWSGEQLFGVPLSLRCKVEDALGKDLPHDLGLACIVQFILGPVVGSAEYARSQGGVGRAFQ